MKQKFWAWMSRKNEWFSGVCGETFTNAEVVYTHIGIVVFLIILGIAENIEYSQGL